MNQVHIIWIWVVPTVYALTLILTWIFPLADVELTTSSKSPFITITLEPAILIRTCSTWRTISRILINTNYTQLAIKTAFRLASKLLDRSRVTKIKIQFLTWTFVNIRFASWTGPEITATALKIIIRCNGTFTVILTRVRFTWIRTSYFYDFNNWYVCHEYYECCWSTKKLNINKAKKHKDLFTWVSRRQWFTTIFTLKIHFL